MSAGVDLSQFFDTFFDEADELLADMEQLLLSLDIDNPDIDQLNGIFRAAHSIKGGAGTFGCFGMLADTTHLLENLLDYIRRGEMALRKDMIDLFLETKDVLTDQVAAYRNQQEPSREAYERICEQLRTLAQERHGAAPAAAAPAAAAPAPAAAAAQPAPAQPAAQPEVPVAAAAASGAASGLPMKLEVTQLNEKDIEALGVEMGLMGEILHQQSGGGTLTLWLNTTTPEDDIRAVCCFIADEKNVHITYEALPASVVQGGAAQAAAPAAPAAQSAPAPAPEAAPAAQPQAAAAQPAEHAKAAEDAKPAAAKADKPADKPAAKAAAGAPPAAAGSSTIRVGVEKVDQIINLVGELVITQAML